MTRRSIPAVSWIVAAVLLAACGSGVAGPTGAGGDGGSGGAGPTAAGGTIGSDDACALLTVDEAAGALHSPPLTTEGSPGDPASCGYEVAKDDEALSLTVVRSGASAQFQAFVDAGSAEDVSGVGDRALWEPSSQRLVFLVGDRLILLHPRGRWSSDPPLEVATAIGKIIAARLTTGSVPSGLAATAPPIATANAACDLLSAEEAAAVLDIGSMTSAGSQAQFCSYTVDATGEVAISTYFQKSGGAETWPGLVAGLTTEPVAGLGEQAVFETYSGALYVLQGDSILQVTRFLADPAAALALDQELARIMLTHL